MNKFYYKYNIHNFKFTIAQIDDCITTITLDALTLDYEYQETELIKKTKQELTEYFNKEREHFDIKIKLTGSAFQNKVWTKMLEIPYGETISYKDLAVKLSNKNYARAVGNACHKNKLLILVPCHRVIGKKDIGGFYYDINIKKEFLKIEEIN